MGRLQIDIYMGAPHSKEHKSDLQMMAEYMHWPVGISYRLAPTAFASEACQIYKADNSAYTIIAILSNNLFFNT